MRDVSCRQLCIGRLIEEGDNDGDDKLDFEEFRVLMDQDYTPSSKGDHYHHYLVYLVSIWCLVSTPWLQVLSTKHFKIIRDCSSIALKKESFYTRIYYLVWLSFILLNIAKCESIFLLCIDES